MQFVHIGDQMQVRVDAIGRSFTGKIVRFTRDVNFETRTMETEIDVENSDLSIISGHVCEYGNATRACGKRDDNSCRGSGSQREISKRSIALDADNRIRIRNVDVGPSRIEARRRSRAGLNRATGWFLGVRKTTARASELRRSSSAEPASDVVRESGGVIDLKADSEENNGGAK